MTFATAALAVLLAAADEAAVRAHFETFGDAWTKADAKAVAATYAADADIVRPGQDPVQGRAAIEAFYVRQFAGPLKDTKKSMTIERVRLVSGELAIVDSRYTIDRESPALHVRGVSVAVLVKRNGQWEAVASRSYRQPVDALASPR
jgi:uncharacterized protein (TIGR02246 family)